MNATDLRSDLAEYRLAVLAALRRDGYAVESALALCRRFDDAICGGLALGLDAAVLADRIIRGEEEADDTPLMPCAP